LPQFNTLKRKNTLNLVKNVNRQDFLRDYFNESIDNEEEVYERPTFKQRFFRYTSNSSLFIFHKDWTIRKICQQLAESPEVLKELDKMIEKGGLDTYHKGSDSDKENFNMMNETMKQSF
jgi:hypothetical protein